MTTGGTDNELCLSVPLLDEDLSAGQATVPATQRNRRGEWVTLLTPMKVQAELDKQLFHLKTLYDVSHELLGLTDVSMILRNFLLMTMGNFGTAQGFIIG